jgi:hypothetical protein
VTILVTLAMLFAAPLAHAEASWSFDPPSWDFGVVVPDSGPTPPKVFTLTNTGDQELSGGFVSVGGNEGSGFSIDENKCGKLAPGASCTISVSFDPSTAGPKNGELGVADLGGGVPPASAGLSGTGAGPVVSITPDGLAFDALEVGKGSSSPKVFTVANEGQLDLTISMVSISIYMHPDADQFKIVGGTCAVGLVVAPDGSCTVEVAFVPTRPGYLAGELVIADDAPGSPHVATVEGVGIGSPVVFPRPPTPMIPSVGFSHRPDRRTYSRSAAFTFLASPSAASFLCRLDGRDLRPCSSPVRYRRLRPGDHRFAVRAVDGNGRSGRAAVVRWRILHH